MKQAQEIADNIRHNILSSDGRHCIGTKWAKRMVLTSKEWLKA